MTEQNQWAATYIGPDDLDRTLHAEAVAKTRAALDVVDLEFADRESGGHTYWPGERSAGAESFYHPGEAADCVTCNPIPVVNYEPGSALEAQHAEYWAAKAEAAAADKRLKTATDKIKLALSEATNSAPKVYLEGPGGRALYLDYRESERLNTKKLREDVDPTILAPYTTIGGAWYLTERKG